jgi:hemolysin activation/secretion protein
MRLQNATDALSFYGAISGQLASKNLDAAEKMELGGMAAVRAYPEGEATADQGYVLNLEARFQPRKPPGELQGQLQWIGFIDTGTVSVNKNPWPDPIRTRGSNHRTLSGVGIGCNWSRSNDVSVRAYYAHKLGNETATSAPDSPGRFWIQAVKYF